MAVKDLIGPGFIGSDTIEFIVTRGMDSFDPQTIKAVIFQSNILIGDSLEEEHFLKGVAVTGFTFVVLNAGNGDAVTSGGNHVLIGVGAGGNFGTQGAVAGSFTHEGNGQWSVNFTATEMDADVIALTFLHADGVPVYKILRTK